MNEIWIGPIGVYADSKPAILQGAQCACVNATALVDNQESYNIAIQNALEQHGMKAFEFADVEPLRKRLNGFEVPAHVLLMTKQTETDGAVHFGEFFLYDE